MPHLDLADLPAITATAVTLSNINTTLGTEPTTMEPHMSYAPQPPGYPPPEPMPPYHLYRTSGAAVTGMILGILSLAVMWLPIIGLVAGGVAVFVSLGGWVPTAHPYVNGRGMVIAGLSTGGLTLVIGLVFTLFALAGQ